MCMESIVYWMRRQIWLDIAQVCGLISTALILYSILCVNSTIDRNGTSLQHQLMSLNGLHVVFLALITLSQNFGSHYFNS